MARGSIVVTGCVLIGLGAYVEAMSWSAVRALGFLLEVLGACVLGFGAFARGNICANVFYRFLSILVR